MTELEKLQAELKSIKAFYEKCGCGVYLPKIAKLESQIKELEKPYHNG